MADDLLRATPPDVDLARQQDDHQYQIACQQIEANLQNLREQREHHKFITVKNNRTGLIFSIAAMIGFFGFG